MDLLKNFEAYAHGVLTECEGIVRGYPSILLEEGMKYMEKLNLLAGGERKSGFSYLMPFWFREAFGLSEEVCHTIAVGNTFALLYFMSQDDIYDSSIEDSKVELLPLSNMFYLDFIAYYRKLFDSSSVFWSYFESYIKQWAENIVWEYQNIKGQAHEYEDEDFIRLSRKAAPLKIPYAALCLLAGKPEYIQCFADMVDYDQAAFQMIDDWRDWKKDIGEHNYTYLLTETAKYNKLDSPELLKEAHVKKAVYVGDVPDKVMNKAKGFVDKARACIAHIDIPYVSLYLDKETEICDSILEKVKEEQSNMMGGGLGSLLSKLTQNQSK
ncbi:MAG: hypothetical protein ACOZCL_05920 [Bacillota bacterium]